MTTYRCDNMRPIHDGDEYGNPRNYESRTIYDAKDAAYEFANRLAKRTYGRRGYCHHVRLDCAAMDGRYGNYEAFIGTPAEGGGTCGRNVWLTVYVAAD